MPLGNNRLVRAMKSRTYGALIASLCAITFTLAANETFAASRAASAHSASHRSAAHMLRHHRTPQGALGWGDDGSFSGANGEATFDGTPKAGVRYSNSNDVPWDWAHRYPPAVLPSDRPY